MRSRSHPAARRKERAFIALFEEQLIAFVSWRPLACHVSLLHCNKLVFEELLMTETISWTLEK